MKPKCKTVFLGFHGIVFRECLNNWVQLHPKTFWWRSGNYGDDTESFTMSVSGWKRFCQDYNFEFKTL